MSGLTPGERRGARVLAIVLAIGTLSDLHRAHAPARAPTTERYAASPAASDTIQASPPVSNAPPARAPGVPLDLDSASVAELDRLPGIGPVLAARIVEHRRLHGHFHHVDELLLVPGIGPRLLERLRPWLREPTR